MKGEIVMKIGKTDAYRFSELSEHAKQTAYIDYAEYMATNQVGECILSYDLFEEEAAENKLWFDVDGKYLM